MSQNDQVLIKQMEFTRTDFTALRAYVQGIPTTKIAQLYYAEDAPQVAGGLDKFLTGMRHELIERSIVAKPALAEGLKHFRDSRGTVKLLSLLIELSNAAPAKPRPEQPIAQWFRPRLARALVSQGIKNLGELLHLIQMRGHRWWRPIPRLGALKAQSIIKFLQNHEDTLGPVSPDALTAPPDVPGQAVLSLEGGVLPLERISALPAAFDGTRGINRVPSFCLINARHDLEAINSYLDLFRGNPSTFRAYRKELERFLAWCIKYAIKPFSSVMVEDCLSYMRFLEAPEPLFCGKKSPRSSPNWRPFGLEPLSVESQSYAVNVITAAFSWLVDMRYLSGNPWKGVKPPSPATPENPIQIEKALPGTLWEKLVTQIDALLDSAFPPPLSRRGQDLSSQFRIARAAMLLMGDSGLRRAEVASATRDNLRPSAIAMGSWELQVLGKRKKWRTVPVSLDTLTALRAHWHDRGENFDESALPSPLLAPLVIPDTPQAAARRRVGSPSSTLAYPPPPPLPYSANALARVVVTALKRIKNHPGFTDEEKRFLEQTSAHSFRHTFGTQSVADGMPIDVAQRIMGHASPATTAIYIQAEKRRMIEQAAKYYENKGKRKNLEI